MSEYIELLGEELKFKEGSKLTSVKTAMALEGKIVGLYFSASWCVNCHSFTPKLRRAYQYAISHGAEFSIVYCHLDQNYNEWLGYYSDMPGWYAVPYERSDIVTSLKSMFNISGIPHFVMISQNGVINPDARDSVEDNPEGFPWSQLSFQEEVATRLKDHNGSVDPSVLNDTNVCYFFGAKSDQDSVTLFNKLMECYNTLVPSHGDVLKVVYISVDNTEEQYNAFYESMPDWYTIGYDVRTARRLLRSIGDTPLPVPVMRGRDGEITSYDSRDLILATGVDSFPWNTVICKDIELDNEGMLAPGLVVFMDDATQFPPQVRDSVIITMQKMANQKVAAQDHVATMNYTVERGETTSYLREHLGKYSNVVPFMAVYKMGDDGLVRYYPGKSFETTETNMQQVIEDFNHGLLEECVISG